MTIVEEFMLERERQKSRHGDDSDQGPHDWIAKIAKHAGLGVMLPIDTIGIALDRFRKQMVTVGALSVAAVEWTDRELKRLTEDRS